MDFTVTSLPDPRPTRHLYAFEGPLWDVALEVYTHIYKL